MTQDEERQELSTLLEHVSNPRTDDPHYYQELAIEYTYKAENYIKKYKKIDWRKWQHKKSYSKT